VALSLLLALVGHGCGFQLRGPVKLPPSLESTFIQGDPYSVLVRELRYFLKEGGSDVTDVRAQAKAVIRILRDQINRRTLSVGSTGKVTEYQLVHSVSFDVIDSEGRNLVKPQEMNVVRNYLYDENEVLGTANQEAVLVDDMRRDAAQLIMIRLMAELG